MGTEVSPADIQCEHPESTLQTGADGPLSVCVLRALMHYRKTGYGPLYGPPNHLSVWFGSNLRSLSGRAVVETPCAYPPSTIANPGAISTGHTARNGLQ